MSEMVRLSHGLWCPADVAGDPIRRLSTVLTAAPDGAVLAGLTAARLHGMWLPPAQADEMTEVVLRHDVVDQCGHAGTRRDEMRGRRRRITDDEIAVVQGLATTSAARTWVDLAEDLEGPDLVAAGDSVLRGLTRRCDLERAVARARGRRGVVRARSALSWLDGRSRSRPESHLRAALLANGLPKPEVNVAVFSTLGEWLAEPDLSYEDVRLAIEYNGADHADVRRMRRDITRTLDLDDRGDWQTLTFGPAQVFGRPEEAAVTVARIRRRRLSELAA